jgi:hypothetical protein
MPATAFVVRIISMRLRRFDACSALGPESVHVMLAVWFREVKEWCWLTWGQLTSDAWILAGLALLLTQVEDSPLSETSGANKPSSGCVQWGQRVFWAHVSSPLCGGQHYVRLALDSCEAQHRRDLQWSLELRRMNAQVQRWCPTVSMTSLDIQSTAAMAMPYPASGPILLSTFSHHQHRKPIPSPSTATTKYTAQHNV